MATLWEASPILNFRNDEYDSQSNFLKHAHPVYRVVHFHLSLIHNYFR
ncbi:hypothetical protein NIES3275_23130 [Microchaete diplosiphon NIES-3275]|nr:hypothetical protein NIES3275_23130 [Microchaete diplosiphon NIES-3275]